MTGKRLVVAILCMFVATWATDFLIHAVLLSTDYGASKELWRSETELQSHMGWLFLGQFMAATAMTVIYARGFAARHCLREACLYGLLMAIMGQAFVPTFYAVQPLPALLCVKWVVFGSIQGVILGLLLYAVCKPVATAAPAGSQGEQAVD